jgi:hypothetical protein
MTINFNVFLGNNYPLGMNLEYLRRFGAVASSIISPIDNKDNTSDMVAAKFGYLHNSSNKVDNPVKGPYYGEISFSGRMITLDYYGNNMDNPIFRNNYDARFTDPINSNKLKVQ